MRDTKTKNRNRGITLIALIITIIVMLILVAVTISMAINGGLFENAGKAVSETKNARDNELGIANGGPIKVGEKWYANINDVVDDIPMVVGDPLVDTENYIGYYADLDGDLTTVEGIIYADLSKGNTGSGKWGTNGEGDYQVPTFPATDFDEYVVTEKTANYQGFGEKPIIARKKKTEGKKDRFYVMALEDLDANHHYWYYNARGKLPTERNEATSTTAMVDANGESIGRKNTEFMIDAYEKELYGDKYTGSISDLWGMPELVAKVNSEERWFVPSKTEWAAFGGELCNKTEVDIIAENYTNFGLELLYWSSSQNNASFAYVADFFNGKFGNARVDSTPCVRLSATF